MEGYFKTPSLSAAASKRNSQPTSRQFTQKEKDALQQKYKERDSIDTLHAARIKVLRDRQERKYQEAVRRMERHSEETAQANRKHLQDLDEHCEDERAAAQSWLHQKKKKLKLKWTLEENILRKRLELQTGESYATLPPILFETEKTSS